jgi:YHYH protein
MDSALPAWIKNNFKCAVGYVSGTNYVFKSNNLPNTKSYYYGASNGSSYPLYEALPSGNTPAGTNAVASQNYTYTIPSTPTVSNTQTETDTSGGSVGITLNGLAIYNNSAAPGDTLATEAGTFDNYQGHPEKTGVYHHHAAVPYVCENTKNTSNSAACNNSSLIGIGLDGYAIYGQKCDNGTSSTSDDFTPTLDLKHGHTSITQHFSTATYHYHYALDGVATIYTLVGSRFNGKKGTLSN